MANNVTDLGKVGITLKGEWSSATNYERLDAVTYDGSLYIAIKDNANVNPGANPTYWLLSAKHGEFTEQQLEDFKAEVVAESKEEMDDYTDDKKAELDTYEGTKETELNTYTGTKKTELDTYASGLKDDFDSNASTKTTAFNDNATSKTTAFNTNATNKTTDFNDNATAKTTEFNTNASNKTDDFDDNVTAKTTAFDEHVEEKEEEFDENVESLQQEIDELSENMPWETTEQATEIQVTDAAKYSRNRLELFGNTEQASYVGKNLFNVGSETINSRGIDWIPQNDGSVKIQGTATGASTYGISSEKIIPAGQYIFSIKNPMAQKLKLRCKKVSDGTFSYASIAIGQTSTIINIPEDVNLTQIYIDSELTVGDELNYTIYPQLEQGSTATDYEPYVGGVPAPNPDYPQDIHVVTGNNVIKRTGKNLLDITTDDYILNSTTGYELTISNDSLTIKSTVASNKAIGFVIEVKPTKSITVSYEDLIEESEGINNRAQIAFYNEKPTALNLSEMTTISKTNKTATFIATGKYALIVFRAGSNSGGTFVKPMVSYSNDLAYEPYHLEEYPVNLGNIELCKIGDYQDYLYKENGNWYKYEVIGKTILDGSESYPSMSWSGGKNAYRTSIENLKILTSGNSSPVIKSDLFIADATNVISSMAVPAHGICNRTNQSEIIIRNDDITSSADIRNWLSEHNLKLHYVLEVPRIVQITDTTLIRQLDAIYEHFKLSKGFNTITVTAEDLAPYIELNYMQDLKSKLDNIDSRLALLE